MSIPSRLIGSVAQRHIGKEVDTIKIDWSRLFYNILFSDHYIIESVRLREIPFLVRKFGYLDTRALLLSGVLSLRCDTYNLGLLNVDNPSHLFHYEPYGIDVDNHNEHMAGCFNEIGFQAEMEGYIRAIDKIELIDIVKEKILPPPKEPLNAVFSSFRHEIEKDYHSLKKLMRREIQIVAGQRISLEEIELNVMPLETNQYVIKNNIRSRFGIDESLVHKLIGKSILALGKEHIRLYKMENDKAISCYSVDDKCVLENSVGYFSRQMNSDIHFESFQRVTNLAGLPQLANNDKLCISRLLEIRNSSEWWEFRRWISSIPDLSDAEIKKELEHKSSKLVARITGETGKIIGHAINIGSAFLNPIQGIAVTYFPWLASKFVTPKGHVVFLYRDYPSIFR